MGSSHSFEPLKADKGRSQPELGAAASVLYIAFGRPFWHKGFVLHMVSASIPRVGGVISVIRAFWHARNIFTPVAVTQIAAYLGHSATEKALGGPIATWSLGGHTGIGSYLRWSYK